VTSHGTLSSLAIFLLVGHLRPRRLVRQGIHIQFSFDLGHVSFQSLTQPLQSVGTLVLLICSRALNFGEDRAIGYFFTERIERFASATFRTFRVRIFSTHDLQTG
jgi:hypothetical protein